MSLIPISKYNSTKIHKLNLVINGCCLFVYVYVAESTTGPNLNIDVALHFAKFSTDLSISVTDWLLKTHNIIVEDYVLNDSLECRVRGHLVHRI